MINFGSALTSVLGVFVAYFIGAIPTGYLIARLKGVRDIREHGSGNIGATNVSRLLGLHYFFLIFLLDAGKAFLFMHSISPYFPDDYLYFFAGILLFGNTCSIFLDGRGGKGVATTFGLLSALNLPAVIFLLSVWCVSMIIIKTVGIASVIAAASLPLFAYISKDGDFILFSCVVSAWIIWLHRTNIFSYVKSR